MILIDYLQDKIEKWNYKIEEKVGKDDFEVYKTFCLRAVENIENMGVYKMAQEGIDTSGFTIEVVTYGEGMEHG
jgi:hypothetical protein